MGRGDDVDVTGGAGGMGVWQQWYAGDPQGLWSLLVVPVLFLIHLLVDGRRGASRGTRRFVFLYCLVFTLETLVDPLCTGLLARYSPPAVGTALSVFFVIVGDFRVLLLTFLCGAVAPRRALLRAIGLSIAVPVLAYAINAALDRLAGPVSGQVLWLCHELLFTALAGALLARYRADPFLRRCLLFVVAYYGLWASSDVLILLGIDAAWLLRAVPNQLYYALWTPWVWWVASHYPPSLGPEASAQ